MTDIWAEIPLTDAMLRRVQDEFAIDVSSGQVRLHGGEESASYRLGEHVLRISPPWRTDVELGWCYAVATAAARSVPEVPAPRQTVAGHFVIRVDDHPVTVWPFVEGAWADGDDPHHRALAAELLARLHRGLEDAAAGPRPAESSPTVETPDLDDPRLDRQLEELDRTFPRRQPLHGDFYRGNVLVRDGGFVALVDWDNAFIGPPEHELAWASWEWSDASDTLDLDACSGFISAYVEAGGPATEIDKSVSACFIRRRLRWEIAYGRAMRERGVDVDEEYEEDITEAYFDLKRLS